MRLVIGIEKEVETVEDARRVYDIYKAVEVPDVTISGRVLNRTDLNGNPDSPD